MFLSTHGIIRNNTASSAYTARTTAFIAATGISDTTIINALNTMDLSLISAGLDTKMKALYPFVGGTASTHKYNFMDARDLDAAFRLTFNGGVTHSSTGVLSNGINGYANTHINAATSLTINSVHYSFYSRTNTSGVFVELGNLLGAYSNHLRIAANVTIDVPYVIVPFTTTSDSGGFWMGNKTSSTYRSAIKNGVTQNFDTTNISATLNALEMFLLCRNDNGTAAFFTNRESAFSSIGDGLSDSEASTFYTITQTFQTSLARQVGVPIVSDSNAQAFLDAAVITDVTQANAVNQLVIDLKAASIWTKMKAVYPFVGGTASTHKFNLVNPVDSDAAFRLTFNGGWTHSSTGALPNGTNGYADTFGTQAAFMTTGSGHMSFYSRSTGATAETKYEMGNYGGPGYTSLSIRNSDKLQGHINTTTLAFTTANTDAKGFYVASRISLTNLIQQKNSTQYTATSTEAYSFGTIIIGAIGTISTPQFWSNKECAFASVGLGLNSSELTSFNSAMTTFQTTLSRNV